MSRVRVEVPADLRARSAKATRPSTDVFPMVAAMNPNMYKLKSIYTGKAPDGMTARERKRAFPVRVFPIGRLVVTRVPRLHDAAGGAMVLLQTAAKGQPYDKGWDSSRRWQ